MTKSNYLRLNIQKEEKTFIALSSAELKHFRIFARKLWANRNVKRLYRGINLEDICLKLHIVDNENLAELADKLFMLGEKPEYFLKKIPYIHMRSCSKKTLEIIFNTLSNETLLHINNFDIKNEDFCSFFLNKKNKLVFINKFNIADCKEKLILRDYYLSLLHQLACSEYKNNSLHISSTEDILVAKDFALNKGSGIILFCWSLRKYIPSIMEKYEMPTYSISPFEEEKEDTRFAGIFPHFIYGIKIIDSNKFIINHHLFTSDNKNIENSILYSGIKINQSDFLKYLEETTYEKYVVKTGNNYTDYNKHNI